MIGTRLAHYEITSHLGSGGMGEVYQATDSKLGRSVAIKFLPEAFSHDTERVSRFEREARVLASLNHSNIAAIHGLEESGERTFLVMELVEGETLAQRIKRGPILVDESLGIAKQICEALEAAHEKGIIHRDLKPANVKITPDGKVKVLDFGLAKAFESESANAALSNSPTLSMAATNAGMILGTAAYMSPEQAKGRTIDKRTDIFAFGCVLYEMLTGRAAFDGDDVQDILGAVLKSEPDWTRLPSDLSPLILRLLRLCLQKDVRKRRQSAGDVRIDIEQALAEPEAKTPPHGRGPRLHWIVAATAILLAVVFAIPAVRHLRETTPPSPPERRTDIVTPVTNDPVSFAISPDGQRLVFVASSDGQPRLWLRPLDGTTAQPLAGTEGATSPFWSPDSKSIGYFADTTLKRIDVDGGLPQKVADANLPRGGAWGPDGTILFAGNISPLSRIPAFGGQATAVTKLDPPRQTSHRFPQFLPGGRQFLFYSQGTPDAAGIYLGSLDSPETKLLTAADTAGLYQSGWLFFIRQGTLMARRFDPRRGELSDDPVTVADAVIVNTAVEATNLGAFSVSATGVIAYRTGVGSQRQLTWFDRSGKALGTMGAGDESNLNVPSVLPGGLQAAVHRTVQGNTDIWLLDGNRTSRFTFDAAGDRNPIGSPDGSQIVFDSNRKGPFNLYIKPSNLGGDEEVLTESSQDKVATDWSADGRFLLYHSRDPQTSWDLWVLPLEGDRQPWVFLKTNFQERSAQFSPDGRWVAYMSTQSGRPQIYIRPFAEPSPTGSTGDRVGGLWPVSTMGGIFPRWRSDGKELYYIGPKGQMMAAPIAVNGATINPGLPVALFQTRISGGGVDNGPIGYDVATDGRFLINTVLDDASSPITLIQNWTPPAK